MTQVEIKILLAYLAVGFKIVVKYIHRYCQVTGIVWIDSVPALWSELPSLAHHGMEIA